MKVILCADTEDNQSVKVAGWKQYGSDYGASPPVIRFDWLKGLEHLHQLFQKYECRINWMIRVDRGLVGNAALNKIVPKLESLGIGYQAFGIHPHTWVHRNRHWQQATSAAEETACLEEAIVHWTDFFLRKPLASKMGWSAGSNAIINTLDRAGIKIDLSALPGHKSTGNRGTNIYDWTGAPQHPYHPAPNNFKAEGQLSIVEIPVTTLSANNAARWLINKTQPLISFLLERVPREAAQTFNPVSDSIFYVSPYQNNSKLIGKLSRSELLVGYFHPSEILDPSSGKVNLQLLRNLESDLIKLSKFKPQYLSLKQCVAEYGS